MNWRGSLGLCLLALTAAGCGAAGKASLPVESAPDAAAVAANASTEAGAEVLAVSDVAVLKSVRVASSPTPLGGARVEIEASAPVNYTTYEPDPRNFIIEIPNVDMRGLPPEVPIGQAGIERAVITSLPSRKGGSHARIQFSAAAPIHVQVTPEGPVLAVFLEPLEAPAAVIGDVARSDAAPRGPEAVPDEIGPAAPPVAAEPPEPLAPASTVSGVVVEESGDGAAVAIVGDGTFTHNTFVLKSPERLVLDLVGVVNRVPEKVIDVSGDPLQRVRVAQFRVRPEKIVRVVFDLVQQSDYRVVTDPDGLRVLLGAAVEKADDQEAPTPPVQIARAPAAPTPDAPAFVRPAANVSPPPVFREPAPAEPAPAAAASTPRQIPDLTPRLVPASPTDLKKDIVLFDRADPGQEAKPEGGYLIAPGATFESRTISGERRRYRGEKISVTFRDADIREVFFFFSDVMKMNIVLDPDVTGRIDVRLTQVPWDQAFQVILKNQGLDAVEEDNVIRIAKTQKLRAEAAERRALKQAQEQEVDPITFTRRLSYAKVTEAMAILQQMKSDRGKIIGDTRTNTLVITDIPDKRASYENLIGALDTQTPQVQIEARIVEAIRSFERSLGIDWTFTGLATPALGTQTNLQFPHRAEFQADVNLGSTTQAGTLGIALGNVLDSVTLDVQLDAFEADGKVRILSSPKVVTQHNQPATIEQGVQIPIVTTTATEIEVQYVPASLRLIVTPQITAEDTVIMKVLVENNQPSATVSVGDTPGIVTERVDTQILVRTGTTAVIGGVYKLQETDNETGLPGLRRIPFFGWLFKNKSYRKDSSELIVFLTPKIVMNV